MNKATFRKHKSEINKNEEENNSKYLHNELFIDESKFSENKITDDNKNNFKTLEREKSILNTEDRCKKSNEKISESIVSSYNPFDDCEEELESEVKIKPDSTNPFGDDNDDEEIDKNCTNNENEENIPDKKECIPREKNEVNGFHKNKENDIPINHKNFDLVEPISEVAQPIESPLTSTPIRRSSNMSIEGTARELDFNATLPTPIPRRHKRLHGSTVCLQSNAMYSPKASTSTLSLNTTFDYSPDRSGINSNNSAELSSTFKRNDGGRGSVGVGSLSNFRRDGVMSSLPPNNRVYQRKKRRAPLPPSPVSDIKQFKK